MSDYYQKPDPKYGHSQGDLIEVAPHVVVPSLPLRQVLLEADGQIKDSVADTPHLVVNSKKAVALILTADCMIDKKNTQFWQICPVVPVSAVPGDEQNAVRKNKVFHRLHLPAGPGFPESFADFAFITTVSKDVIQQAKVLATLSDMARRALYAQQFRYFARLVLDDVQCPSCFASIDLKNTMCVRAI